MEQINEVLACWEEIKDVIENWKTELFVAEQWKSALFLPFVELLENVIPHDAIVLEILDACYRAFVAQLVYRYEAVPGSHDRYCAIRQRVVDVLSGAAPATPSPQVGGGRVEEASASSAPDADTPQASTSRAASQRGEKRPAPQDDQDVEPVIEVLASSERYLGQFKATFRQETFQIKDLQDQLLENNVYMESMFDELIKRQCDILKAKDDDRCILEIVGEDATKAIWFHLRKVSQINGRVLLDKLCKTLNSNESFFAGMINLTFIHVPAARGSSRDVRNHEDVDNWIQRYCKTGSLYDPSNNTDQMCLARCLAFLMLFNNTCDRTARSRLRNPSRSDVAELALRYCREAGVDPDADCGYEDMVKFQAILQHRLVVFLDQKCKEIIFCGPHLSEDGEKRKALYIIQHRDHFYAVIRIKAVTGAKYFCDDCLKTAASKLDHRCESSCTRCDGGELHTDTPLLECKNCCRYFAGAACLQQHLQIVSAGKSICDIKKFCKKCTKFYVLNGKSKMKKHVCNWKICKYCNEYMPSTHQCHMVPWEEKTYCKNTRYIKIYFDIEARQDECYEGRNNWMEHKPNLLICQQVCDVCENEKNIEVECEGCGQREHVFEGFDPDSNVVGDFIKYLIRLNNEKKTHITLFACNFKSYDGYFITQELLKENITPKVKLVGAKILSLETKGFHFKCSLSFLPQRLSSLPKSFGLKELKKGYFCHMANNEKWYDYSGPIPPKDLYCCSTFTDKELSEFNRWHDEQINSNYLFNFKDEIISYCRSDVQILREAMQSFKKLFMESAGFDPLFNCITLSSACMANFRRNHLSTSAIGIVPRGGYRGRDKASYEACKWLSYEEHVLGHKIIHAENSREVLVLNSRVDGYVEFEREDGSIEKRIYAYHGCFFHLCPKCIPDRASRARIMGRSNDDPYENTKRITKKFRDAGYVVIEKWGCEFHDDLKNNTDVITFFKNNPYKRIEPLNLRDALFGGRTSALYSEYVADVAKGEQIKFFDVISEYPAMQKNEPYPEGHPKIYLEGDHDMPDLNLMNGVIKATILPPTNLFLPVLPYKSCNKLLFPLCKSCADNLSQTICNHSDEERMLVGTWPVPEVKVAVEKGYNVKEIHECYQYPIVRKYNPVSKEDGLFSSYVRQNMAMKIESTGWPCDVESDEQKDAFIKMHFDNDGIVLDKAKFEKNPGKRTLAKLILNSFWGKLGEKTQRPQTKFVKTYSELSSLMEDSTITITSLTPFGEDILQVKYNEHEDLDDSYPTTSVIHALFTTMHGRLHLYKYLSIVDERALYHDTDSICFISRDKLPEPPLGIFLGDLSDQLHDDYGPGSFCTHFVSAGAKNYAYKVCVGGDLNNVKTVVKVRGITINSSSSKTVTFERLRSMVRGEYEKTNVNIPAQITRMPRFRIITKPSSKTWRVCLTKRRRVENKTVPYGFRGQLLDEDDYDCMLALSSIVESEMMDTL